MDLHKIKMLMDLVENSEITELEVHSGDESVRIVRPLPLAATQEAPSAAAGSTAPAPAAAPAQQGYPVRAPMAGTFYAGPDPGADPFVAEGQSVSAGDVLCIIESMKMMNEIKSERGGVCSAVTVANGQSVNAGDILFRIT